MTFQIIFQRLTRAALLASLAATPASALAQFRWDPPPASNLSLLAVNGLAGGTIASVRALLGARSPARAFAVGSLGGMVHFAGKLTSVSQPNIPLGLPLSAAGASIVANAGAGARIFEEITLPVAFARLHVRPYAPRKIHAAVNLYDAVVLGQLLAFDGMRFDGRRSLATGMPAFDVGDARIFRDGDELLGVTFGPAFAMSTIGETGRTVAHEAVHVQQYWFASETVGRPIEEYVRRRIPAARYIPGWLELGVVTWAARAAEYSILRGGGWSRLIEAEAESLARP